MRKSPIFTAAAVCLISHVAVAADAPDKALKYHAVLLKRPHNAALFDRFYGAWLDEKSVEEMGDFLKARAEKNGGAEWGVLATWQLRQGAEDDALASLAKGISANPADMALPMERAKVLLRRLDFDKARADLATVAAGSDEALALEAGKLAGKSWLREGNVEKAVAAWDAVLAAHPADEDLLEDLVETAAGEGETAQALVYLDKLIGLGADPYKKTLRMLRRGDLLAQGAKTDDAVKAYAATLAQTGADSWLEREVLAQIDKLFRKQDRLDDLSAELEKLGTANPQRLAIQRQLAKLEIARGETDKAIGRFREVLKRSPGERQLREEFIRLLGDGERYDDAVAELEKLAESAPEDAELQLQIASLRSRQNQPDAALAALEKAHKLLGDDEAAGLRIAGLMLSYHLEKPGEALLKSLAEKPGASPSTLEALASRYGQTLRKDEAVALLKKAGAGKDLDALLRTTGSISALGESKTAFETLQGRQEEFAAEPRFLTAYCQAALAAEKPAEAVPQALKLVRLASQASELADGIGLASRVISGAKKADEIRETLEKQDKRSPAETCLLASLLEDAGDSMAVEKLLDPATDSMVVHFHAALLDRRGDFDQAIAVMTRLADTDEGRKAGYFKDLSELQQRAGRPKEALATVERWKLGAPGDKTAWVVGSRLLRELGQPEDAVKMTRHAVARFEGDVDLQASLASLHEDAGQWADAEAIYWRLYDEGQSPLDQARWAAQLAQLAKRTGATAELEEKFQERQRGNRRSIGPLLAQAELARITNNEDKRRDLLLEAVRLQPKDLDLRMQIAEIEEKAGNPERAQAVLEEALPFDENGRVRSALAQAYLRQGEAVKGMRELRALSGKSGFDARSAEAAAATLAGIQLYSEAIELLRGELKNGGDWRSRYLLATLLEEDGREDEAEPVFLSLLAATGEIPALAPPAGANPQSYNPYGNVPANLREITETMGAVQVAYAQRNRNGYNYFGRQPGFIKVGNFVLPDEPEKARLLAAVHLATLAGRGGKSDAALIFQMEAAGAADPDFLTALATAKNGDDQPDMMKIFAGFPEKPGLAEFVLSYGGMYGRETDQDEVRKIAESTPNLSARARFLAWSRIAPTAGADDPAWGKLAAAAKEWIADDKDDSSSMITWQLVQLLQRVRAEIPAADKQALKEAILAAQAKSEEKHPEYAHGTGLLNMVAVVGTPDEWLAELNAVVRQFREKPAAGRRGGSPYGNYSQTIRYALQNMANGGGDEGLFAVPSLDRLVMKSLPQDLLPLVFATDRNNGNPPPPLAPEELLKRAGEIESPLLSAIVAVKSGDAAAIEKAMNGEIPPLEETDFQVLRAVLALQDKKPAEAFEALDKARESGGRDRDFSLWANTSLIAVAGAMTAEERAGVAERLVPIVMQCRQAFGQQGSAILAAQARQLGLEDLAKRLQPVATAAGAPGAASTGPAALAVPQGNSSGGGRQQAGGSVEKVQKFVARKKYEAAAREVLTGLRGQTNNREYYLRQQIPQFATMLGKDGVAALLSLLDPAGSQSLVRRLEYADVCIAIGKPELAAPVLEALAKERPDDASIAGRLILTIDPADADRWAALMTRAAKSDEFVEGAGREMGPLGRNGDNKGKLDFFGMIAGWLEKADPAEHADANLTWVTYNSKRFFEGNFLSGIGSLFAKPEKSDSKPDKDRVAEIARQKEIAERLARAMLRHPTIAEEGFRLLAASKAWEIKPAEMDALARQALLSTASIPPGAGVRNGRQVAYFQYQTRNSGSSSGGDLSGESSVAWLAERLAKGNPSEIMPPTWLAELTAANPGAGKIVASLSKKPDAAEMEALWKSDFVSSNSGDRIATSLRPLIMRRIASTPGSAAFFKKLLLEIPAGQATDRYNNGDDQKNGALIAAALEAAALGNPAELDEIAKAVKLAIFGKLEFSETEPVEAGYQELNFLERMFQNEVVDPAVAVAIQQAFFRLGVPTADDESSACRPFYNRGFASQEEGVKFLESLGWLADAEHWRPYSALLYNRVGQAPNGNGYLVTIKPTLVLDRAMQYLNFPNNRDEMAKKLASPKSPTFGALMTAAAMTSGTKRQEYADRAFQSSAAALAKLPEDRIAGLSLVLPWLSEGALAKLPEKFRGRLKRLDEANREAAIARADAFLKNLPGNMARNGNFFGDDQREIAGVLRYAPDKAAEMFIAGDDAFTASLSRGGRYAYTNYNEWEVAMRDYFFGNIVEAFGSNNDITGDPAQMLDFLARILASPSGARLQFTGSSYRPDSAFPRIAKSLLGNSTKGEPAERLEKLVTTYQKWREKSPAEIVFPAFLLADLQLPKNPDEESVKAARAKIETLAKDDQPAAAVAEMAFAPWAWKRISDEEKSAAIATCARLLADLKIPDSARIELATRWLALTTADAPLDPALGSAIDALYREYCAAGRSAVSRASAGLFAALVKSRGTDDAGRKLATSLGTAFWENAGAPNVAGHPAVPSELAQSVFLLAVRGGDKEAVAKNFPRIRDALAGKLAATVSLLSSGQTDLARQIAPPTGELFATEGKSGNYDRALELVLADFAKTAADPITLQKLEIELLARPAIRGDDAPKESDDARLARVVADFAANPPQGDVLPWALEALLAKAPGNPQLLEALMKWAAANPVVDSIILGNNSNPLAENRTRVAAIRLHGRAAMHGFDTGDTTLLKALAAAIDVGGDSNYHLYQDLSQLTRSMTRIFWVDVCNGATAGFKDGAADWDAFTLAIAKQIQHYNSSEVVRPLMIASLVHGWNGDVPGFEKLCDALPDPCKSSGKQVSKSGGFMPFAIYAKEYAPPGNPAASRAAFLAKMLVQPGFAPSYAREIGWVAKVRSGGYQEEIDAIALDPPAGTLKEALVELHEQAGDLKRKENPEGALAEYKLALESCTDAKEWNDSRGVMKWKAADVMLAQGDKAGAKETFGKIGKDEIAGWLKDRYNDLAKKLDAKPAK